MKKSCHYCGRIHEKDYDCGKKPHRIYGKYERKPEERGRYSYAFKQTSKQVKVDSGYLCAYCLYEGKLTYEDLETHHITKLVDAPELVCEESNLICLCRAHHRMADEGRLPTHILRQLASQRGTPQGVRLDFSKSPPPSPGPQIQKKFPK